MQKYPFLFLLLSFIACGENRPRPLFKKFVNYEKYPAMTEDGFYNAVIEIPAGTNVKNEYDYEQKKIVADQRDGKDRIVNFLPYPGNYGYIPGTVMDKARGGDGDAVDVLVLAQHVPVGTVMKVRPVATLLLFDENEADTKIIAVPADSTLQIMQIPDFETFMVDYDAARRMIEDWFMNYDGYGINRLGGWKDARYGEREIEKWVK